MFKDLIMWGLDCNDEIQPSMTVHEKQRKGHVQDEKLCFKHLVGVELYLITPCWTSYFQFPQVILLGEQLKYLTT